MESAFKLDDWVTWTSQAGGYTRTKTGQVAQVVPPKTLPDRERFLALYKGAGVGMWRPETSYVIRVGGKAYWPRVSQLQPAP